MRGKQDIREGFISKCSGGVRERLRRHCGTWWNRHHGGTNRGRGKGAGQNLTGSKRAGERLLAGTGQRPIGLMSLEWRVVMRCGSGTREGERGGVEGRGVG